MFSSIMINATPAKPINYEHRMYCFIPSNQFKNKLLRSEYIYSINETTCTCAMQTSRRQFHDRRFPSRETCSLQVAMRGRQQTVTASCAPTRSLEKQDSQLLLLAVIPIVALTNSMYRLPHSLELSQHLVEALTQLVSGPKDVAVWPF